jgi:hypothetical protein
VQSTSSIITTLIDLLTIEARSFSSQIIKTIKIVEMSSGPVLLPSYHQPPKPPQSVVVISTNQPIQQHQTSELNRTNTKFLIQQHTKPLTLTDIISSGSILSVSPSSTIVQNSNDKKRKHDCKFFYFEF